ncbi:hypothetical protein HK100_011749 [Physocladia obscura]|uniref:Uncharacterized protein n=1 Tax=Physocladia obscura TaxID=109957 RepID=A0AAD5T0U2_9FUNG|nr:hypothetical protein HK100_011749 [Physocladia obscura]
MCVGGCKQPVVVENDHLTVMETVEDVSKKKNEDEFDGSDNLHLSDVGWAHLFDVHCHLSLEPASQAVIPMLKVAGVWLMAMQEHDWSNIQAWASANPAGIVPAYGIHPWCAHTTTADAFDLLRARLIESPFAFVGEIGLDGVATYPDSDIKYEMNKQLAVYTAQLNLAAELSRPVSIHAVSCFGKLESIFQNLLQDVPKDLSRRQKDKLKKDNEPVPTLAELAAHPALRKWPPAIMLHSYSGSSESIQRILRYPSVVASRFYFSFSYFVNSRIPFDRLKEKICLIPDDQILIESDHVDATRVDRACLRALDLVARAKGWSLEETALKTGANALRFISKLSVR